MGIDCWKLRAATAKDRTENNNERVDEHAAESTDIKASLNTSPPMAQLPLIADCGPADIGERVRDTKVHLSASSGNARLLIVLERALTPAAQDLLEAMLKAIDVEIEDQPVAIITDSLDADPLAVVAASVGPVALLVMATLPDGVNFSELEIHRKELQRYPWLSVPVAITLHPQVLLDDNLAKRPAWEDLKRVQAFLHG